MPSKWEKMTPGGALVLERLIEAEETNRADRTRVFPKGYGSSMPDYVHDPKEWWAMLVDDAVHNKARAWEDYKRDRNRRGANFAKLSSDRVSRAEECETWWRLIEDPEARSMLRLFVISKLTGRSWAETLTIRNKKFHSSKAWVKNKSFRQIHQSLEYLFAKLSQFGINWLHINDLQVGQISPELVPRSSHSAISAWSDEKWMPVIPITDEQPDKR